MSQQAAIKRYQLILEKLNKNQVTSLLDIKDYLDDFGFEISERTLQRDFETLRVEYGIEITYNRSNNCYFVDMDQSPNYGKFINYLNLLTTANFYQNDLQDINRYSPFIQFESSNQLQGIYLIKDLLTAIYQKQRINFNHFNFHTQQLTNYNISPVLLKQFKQRWYIIGLTDALDYRTFGLDRIHDLVTLAETFEYNDYETIKEKFNQIIGLNYSNGAVQHVLLQLTSVQYQFCKALPLHVSQQLVEEGEDFDIISIDVIPNYELLQLLLSFGNEVNILEPASLVADYKTILQETLGYYT